MEYILNRWKKKTEQSKNIVRVLGSSKMEKSYSDWDIDDVCSKFLELGASNEDLAKIKDEEIDGQAMVSLTEAELQSLLEHSKMGVRIRIRNWLKKVVAESKDEEEDGDDEDGYGMSKKRERSTMTPPANPASLKRIRESVKVPETDPRSTSLYQSIATYSSTRTQEGPKRRSGEKAINSQIMKSGGEINFVNKV